MTKPIRQSYQIHAPIEKVWEALVDADVIEKWGGGPAKMLAREETEFSLWGGDIHGTNKKIIKDKKLSQEWYGGKWDKPSHVTFDLSERDGITTVNLEHLNVPKEDIDSITEGWKQYYMGPLKKLLEK